MNMLLWTNHVTEKHYPIIDEIKNLGYDGIEIPLGNGDESHYANLGSHLSNLNLEATAVTSLLEDTNIASPDKSIREAGLNQLKWAMDIAQAANIKTICGPFHLGPILSLFGTHFEFGPVGSFGPIGPLDSNGASS